MTAANRTGTQTCVLYLIIASLLQACTTMQSVTDHDEYAKNPVRVIADQVKVDDKITLVTRNRATHDFTVIDVTDSAVWGVSCQDCEPIGIEIANIEQLYVENVSAAKSVGAGAGVIAAAILLVALVAGPTFAPGL